MTKITLLNPITDQEEEFVVKKFEPNRIKLIENDKYTFLLKGEQVRYYLNEIFSAPISCLLMNSRSQDAWIVPRENSLALLIKYEDNLKMLRNIIPPEEKEKVIGRKKGHFYYPKDTSTEITMKEALSTTYQNRPLPEIFYRRDIINLIVQGIINSKLDQHCSNLCVVDNEAFNIDNGMALPFWQYESAQCFISMNIQNLFYYFIDRGYVASLSEFLLQHEFAYALDAAANKLLANKPILMEGFVKSISSILDNPKILNILLNQKICSRYETKIITQIQGRYYWNFIMNNEIQQVLLDPEVLWNRIEANAKHAKCWAAAICRYKRYTLPENSAIELSQLDNVIREVISPADYNQHFHGVQSDNKEDFTVLVASLGVVFFITGITIAIYQRQIHQFFKEHLNLKHVISNHIATIFATACFGVTAVITVALIVQKTDSIAIEAMNVNNDFFKNMCEIECNVC